MVVHTSECDIEKVEKHLQIAREDGGTPRKYTKYDEKPSCLSDRLRSSFPKADRISDGGPQLFGVRVARPRGRAEEDLGQSKKHGKVVDLG